MDKKALAAALGAANQYTDEKVASIIGGVKYMGSSTYAQLPIPSEANKGHMYTVTDRKNHEFVSDGLQWVDLGIELDFKVDKAEGTFSIGKDENGIYILED